MHRYCISSVIRAGCKSNGNGDKGGKDILASYYASVIRAGCVSSGNGARCLISNSDRTWIKIMSVPR